MDTFDIIWNNSEFNNSKIDIKNNEYIKTEIKKIVSIYLPNVEILQIVDHPNCVFNKINIVMNMLYKIDTNICNMQMKFDLSNRLKIPHSVKF